ncbi:uL30 family ribosomal protein [Candidatus Woesearchaeota archaeon]|nr:uL30 family ribosomal protein [Candidatus Woesearchaeota archaeon]
MPKEESKEKNGKIAIVRVRGSIGAKNDIDRTLNQLRLYKKNYCVIVPGNESYAGMVNKVNDYVTWGNLDGETYNLLVEKKSEEYKGRVSDKKEKVKYNHFLNVKGKKIKKFFRLNSPRKGYGRKGIKMPFKKGGALGYRAEKINDLIKRMI